MRDEEVPEAGKEEGNLGEALERESDPVGIEAGQHAVDGLRAQLEATLGQRRSDFVPCMCARSNVRAVVCVCAVVCACVCV